MGRRRIQLRDDALHAALVKVGRKSARCQAGKIRRRRGTGNINVLAGVESDRIRQIGAATAQIGCAS